MLFRSACITGTKGKSTTTAIAGALARGLGARCVVGGNLGSPPWDPELATPDGAWFLVETSSYQAQSVRLGPRVVAVTSLSQDHLTWHHGYEAYVRDKLSLCTRPGVEVVLTRRTDVFIPLEERTAIANRHGADLFLSIHANSSKNAEANGIETFYLSFASSPDAEAVAARENSASEREMHQLPDIIKAIALNNKLDESRDLATMVLDSLVGSLKKTNKDVRSRGVKKAP